MRDDVAHAPAGHHEILGKAVQRHRAIRRAGQRAHGDEFAIVEIARIDFIGEDQKIIFLRQPHDHAQRIQIIRRAGGVAGGVYDHRARFRRDRAANRILVRAIAVGLARDHLYRAPARQRRLRCIIGKIRAEHDHLVVGVQNAHQRLRHADAAGGRHQHFILRNILTEILLPRAADGGNQLRIALGIAVMGVARAGVGIRRIDDSPVRGKIRIADAQINHIGIALQRFRIQRKPARIMPEPFGNVFTHHFSSPFTYGTTVLPLGIT